MERLSLRGLGMVIGGEVLPDLPIRGFASDSRLVLPGFVFFALKGDQIDGHKFLKEVSGKGAICAVVSKEFKEEIPGLYLIYVDDPLVSLQQIAKYKLDQKKIRCIGITGSVGKTTTKEFIATILEGAFKVLKTPGNANSQVGVPLSILNMEEDGDIFVVEMGMSSHKNILNLLEVVSPEVVVMTKVALAHALFFPGGLEEIAQAKAEILLHPSTKKAFIHMQAREFQAFQKEGGPEKVFYGLASDPLSRKEDIVLQEEDGRFFIRKGTELLSNSFELPFRASHFLENFLAAALVGREFGMDFELIFKQAMKLTAFQSRFEFLKKEGVLYVNDSYNANPESVKAALQNLPQAEIGQKKIAVLGEMRELGSFSKKAHEEIGKLASHCTDLLFCLAGDAELMAQEFSKSGKPAYFFHDLKDLKKALQNQVEKGDVVLVKASKSLRIWEVLE